MATPHGLLSGVGLLGLFSSGVFSQIDVVPSWMTLIIQGGSFALIAYIIIVVYPRVAVESANEREKRDERFIKVVEILQEKFEGRNREIIAAMENQTRILVAATVKGSATIKEAVKEVKENGH